MPRARFQTVPLSQIIEPPAPLRGSHDPEKLAELAASMKELGQLQPILVVSDQAGYRIIAGHRRYLAAMLLGWEKMDVKILAKEPATADLYALAENVHREDLTPVEEARVLYRLIVDDGRDVDAVALQFGKGRAWVDGRLELSQFPADLLQAVHHKAISLGVARELSRVNDNGYRAYLLHYASENGATIKSIQIQVADWEASRGPQGEALTAGPQPGPVYQGQDVGLGCAGCGHLHPIGDLRPLHYCTDCLKAYFAQKAEAARLHRAPPGS